MNINPIQVESLTDINALRTIAFDTFKMSFKMIQGKRERHHKLIKVNYWCFEFSDGPCLQIDNLGFYTNGDFS